MILPEERVKRTTLDGTAAIGYTSAYATTAFRRATGTPVTSWINQRRITAAQRLFIEQNVDVAVACEAVRFNDVRYGVK